MFDILVGLGLMSDRVLGPVERDGVPLRVVSKSLPILEMPLVIHSIIPCLPSGVRGGSSGCTLMRR